MTAGKLASRPGNDILIVDDNPENLRLLAGILSKRGYRVRPASTGARALATVQQGQPDLILLDIMMPDMDGYQVCEQLQAGEHTRGIPVIFVSALGETLDKVKALRVGGLDYITKPFQAEEVIARVETHLALHSLQKSLQAQVTELDAFAHTVAHDLKNPLNLLLGYADLLVARLAGNQDEMLQEYAEIIVRVGYKMDSIIDGLLLLSGVRTMEEIIPEPLDMAEIVAEARARLVALIAERQAELVLPDRWPRVLGYSPWVEQVWSNLLSNAIKYGGRPDESIAPRVELGFDAPRMASVRFWVHDNGPGLTAEEQARLFAPFTRLHQAGIQGHGLGLSIVQRIVDKLGGQVGVESVVGQGSTFFFTLPSMDTNPG